MRPPLFPQDPAFWFETLRCLSQIVHGGADFGEVVVTSARIVASDYDSWHDAWLATADRVAAEAEKSLAGGHAVSARHSFLRASNYYRSADFFLHARRGDPRSQLAWERGVVCFQKAANLFAPPIERVEIPYEGTTLPGYLYRVDRSSQPRPTVIMHTGYDGTGEEMHFCGATAALERGYTVLIFEGPGQGQVIRRQGLTFRPDWERVVGPVLDFALARPEVDARRVALYGVSLGGYLAPRAAAFERRLAAVVALDGIFGLAEPIVKALRRSREEVQARARAESDPELDAALDAMMKANSMLRWSIPHGMWVMGANNPRCVLAKTLEYTLEGVAEHIACPTLVCAGESDLTFLGQPEKLFASLTAPKTFLLFTDAEGAGAHCQAGAVDLADARIFDWLDEALG